MADLTDAQLNALQIISALKKAGGEAPFINIGRRRRARASTELGAGLERAAARAGTSPPRARPLPARRAGPPQ